MDKKFSRYSKLILWIIILLFIGSMIGVLARGGIDIWYPTLNRAPFSPPNYVFGIAWSILYTLLAISGWMIWQATQVSNINSIKFLYMTQLLLNWCWSPFFFNEELTGIALICIVMIIILVAMLIGVSYKKMTTLSLLQIPYLCWLIFAAYLNFYIWYYN